MTEPTAIDGSEGPLITRRIVVWRRLEPGDARTPGTELAPESPHLEAKILEVGIGAALHADLERLWKKRDEVTAIATRWTTRYEPAGVLLAIGGTMLVGGWLDYLPAMVLPLAGSFVILGVAVGVWTKVRKVKGERQADRRWRDTKEREELGKIERRLTPRWERFATELREDTGFRADVRVGDIHEADRLVSIDPARLSHPDTWRSDPGPADVRYGWLYSDGRVVEQTAEIEDDPPAPAPDAVVETEANGDDDEESGDAAQEDGEHEDEAEPSVTREK